MRSHGKLELAMDEREERIRNLLEAVRSSTREDVSLILAERRALQQLRTAHTPQIASLVASSTARGCGMRFSRRTCAIARETSAWRQC